MSQETTNLLLQLLEKNCNYTNEILAIMCATDEDEIKKEKERMEKEGMIRGYHAVVDWIKAGKELVTAMIDVKVAPEREVGFNRVADRIARFPEVKSLYLMSGAFDLTVVMQGRTMQEIADFVSYKLSTIDGVQQTNSRFVLNRYKDDSVIFEQTETDTRLVVAP